MGLRINILLLLSMMAVLAKATFEMDTYKCSFCVATAERMKEFNEDFSTACGTYFPSNLCADLPVPATQLISDSETARDFCESRDLCMGGFTNTFVEGSDPNFDIRVTKALGSKGYNKVRVSVISNRTIDSSIFNYKSQFKYRWTDKYLSTGEVTVNPGQTTKITIGSKTIDVYLPAQKDGVRGVILADPCFQSEWIKCLYQSKFDMFNHTTALLNAINGHDDVHYWQILGDNFYDQQGQASSQWFAALSDATKSKIFATVPGNHDFWVNSAPKLYVPKDQLGNGFMQFYGQDTKGSSDASPYDFSADPDKPFWRWDKANNLPKASNYFFYNQVGNVAFIGYSGAHTFASMTDYFNEACTWAVGANPDVLLLLGHWNSDGDGCEAESAVPAAYKEIAALPSCAPIASKIRYFMGHKHCNIVTEKDIGFMVGAQGMSDASDCGGAFGIPVVDTTGGTFKVYYFPIAQANEFDNYDATLSCITANGVSGCYHLATLWAETPL